MLFTISNATLIFYWILHFLTNCFSLHFFHSFIPSYSLLNNTYYGFVAASPPESFWEHQEYKCKFFSYFKNKLILKNYVINWPHQVSALCLLPAVPSYDILTYLLYFHCVEIDSGLPFPSDRVGEFFPFLPSQNTWLL